MSANLKDSNLQMLALSSGVFAHSQHESLVCGLPLHCLYITYYSTDLPHNLPNVLILDQVSANTRRCATPQENLSPFFYRACVQSSFASPCAVICLSMYPSRHWGGGWQWGKQTPGPRPETKLQFDQASCRNTATRPM